MDRTTALARVKSTFPDFTGTAAGSVFDEVHYELCGDYALYRSNTIVPIVAGTSEMTLSADVTGVESVTAEKGPDSRRQLDPTEIVQLNLEGVPGAWQFETAGAARVFYAEHGKIGIVPAPDTSTLVISAATNASPIVVTTTAAHGLATGDRVKILGALGNTAANGSWDATVLSATTFSLVGSTGNGAWTSGGYVCSLEHPWLNIHHRAHVALAGSDQLPSAINNGQLHIALCREKWAAQNASADVLAKNMQLAARERSKAEIFLGRRSLRFVRKVVPAQASDLQVI